MTFAEIVTRFVDRGAAGEGQVLEFFVATLADAGNDRIDAAAGPMRFRRPNAWHFIVRQYRCTHSLDKVVGAVHIVSVVASPAVHNVNAETAVEVVIAIVTVEISSSSLPYKAHRRIHHRAGHRQQSRRLRRDPQ